MSLLPIPIHTCTNRLASGLKRALMVTICFWPSLCVAPQ